MQISPLLTTYWNLGVKVLCYHIGVIHTYLLSFELHLWLLSLEVGYGLPGKSPFAFSLALTDSQI